MKHMTAVWTRLGRLALALPAIGWTASCVWAGGSALPLFFTPAGSGTGYLVRRGAMTVEFGPREVVFRSPAAALALEFQGAAGGRPEAAEPLAGVVNYFSGAQPDRWRTSLPTFAAVVYRELYPGVELAYRADGGALKSEFQVAAGGRPDSIRWRYRGARSVRVGDDGSLVVNGGAGELREHAPVAFQESTAGRVPVEVRYRVHRDGSVGFDTGQYDRSVALTIDPVLMFSTYLGGSGLDTVRAAAVDSRGNIYLAGYTDSTNLPVAGGVQTASKGGVEAFVAKLNAAATALVYCTYLGGSYDDRAFGIAVDASGNAYVTGWTYSPDFPVTSGARQTSLAGGRDAFVSKLSPAGNALVYSTYLGGGGNDSGNAIAVDASGNAYVAGDTYSTNFPASGGYQSANAGRQDAFVAKLASTGTSLVWSTYLGGAGDESAAAVAVDSGGNVITAGTTNSTNLPTYLALQSANRGGDDAFVTRINAAGTSLGFSTYLGGSGGTVSAGEAATGVALDASGNIYVAGYTSSTNFPVVNAYQSTFKGGGLDGFLVKLAPAGNSILFGTYFGGSAADYLTAVAVDGGGMPVVAGYTASSDMPLAGAVQSAKAGGYDALVVRFNAAGSALDFSTYLGGSDADAAYAIAADTAGSLWVAGQTSSTAFPTRNPIQSLNAGGYSGFAARLGDRTPTAVFRATNGNTILMRYGTTTLYNALGYVTSDVGVSQTLGGDTYVTGRNDTTCAYLNIFAAATRTWLGGWIRAGCGVYGDPAVAARPGGSAVVVARDASYNYYLAEYTAGVGFGAWVGLGGGFATEPVAAASSDGTVYVVGRNSGGVVSAGRYVPGGGFTGWSSAPASFAATGKPAITIGSDGAAYIAVRASGTHNTWVIRLSGDAWGSWVNLGGQAKTDPDVAAAGGKIYAAVTNIYDMVYVQALPEGAAGIGQGWVYIGGSLTKAAIANFGAHYAVAGRNSGGALYWYHSAYGWTYLGSPGLAVGETAASPK